MSLSTGTRLGPYEIEAPIGAGGMGEVYRAKDTRLDRTVAIKVLPRELSAKPGLRQRFEREARAIASLNHPHICSLYDVGAENGVDFLVMEYLEGDTLAARLSHGALKTEQLLRHAIQIAEALDKAHRKGFVHRDLKPGNIMLTQAGVKLLDFGLAQFTTGEKVTGGGDIAGTAATLIGQPLTVEGTILGTLPYMAPEQLEGKETDARTDIFAFGAILYEMATGKRAFEGKSQASLIAAILAAEPKPLRTLQPLTPTALERLVQTCLAKDPEERWQNAHDMMRELEWIAEAKLHPEEAAPPRRSGRERMLWVVTTLLLVALMASLPFTIAYLRQAPVETPPMRFPILLPEKANLGSFAVSPDGRWLAFTAATGGNDQLWVRGLDAFTAQTLPGTEGARYPFWSPDSRSIGFFAGGKLKKIEFSGGPVQTLWDAGAAWGGTWNRDGVIVFSTISFGLFRVAATGGSATLMTPLDRARLEADYHSPSFLPDGRHFLYYTRSGRKETRGIYLGSLDSAVKQRLLGADSNAVYAPSLSAGRQAGYLLFMREGALLAQPFDTQQLQLTGEPLPVAPERVGRDPHSTRGNFSVSENGILVYDPSVNRQSKQLIWVDRQGKPIGSLGMGGSNTGPKLSPDEKRVVLDRFDNQMDTQNLWLYDVAGGGASRFTFAAAYDIQPLWSPDGSRIVWASIREGIYDLYQKAASGAGQEEPLLKSSNWKFPNDWSRDGRFIVYYQIDPKTKRDLWVLPLSGDQKPFPFLQTGTNEVGGQLSPDGRWMAYASDESGGYEVYVQSFPSAGGQRQVSTKGGAGPRWRRDGKELFYCAPDGKLMAVEVKSGLPAGGHGDGEGATFETGVPHALFEFRSGNLTSFLAPYTVTADGRRFLLNTIVDESGGAPLTVRVNWQAGLKQ
jgi:eukaryotic-like serine/threonine-protein kinase